MKEYFVWCLKLLTTIFVFFLVAPFFLFVAVGGMLQSFEDIESEKPSKYLVAVIELDGPITSSKKIIKELHKAVENEDIKGIVLRVDSPGGLVAPSQDIYETVKALKVRKPIVASLGSVAASGGLYVVAGASKVFAQPGTLTGSIGVLMQVPNLQRAAQWLGIEMITIKSGKLKDVGNSFREMTRDERLYLEDTIKSTHQQFVQAISDGRGIEEQKVASFADGRVILGSEAKDLGLVDEFGGVYEAARAVFALRGEPLDEGVLPELRYKTDRFAFVESLLEASSGLLQKIRGQNISLHYSM